LPIVLRWLRQIGDGRELLAGDPQPQGNQVDLADIRRSAANLDFGNAGHHYGRANRHQQFVWPGIALEENVGTAHVCEQRRGGQKERWK
jgi:hypothetical protein